MSRARVKIINHRRRARDEEAAEEGAGNLPWERQQPLNEAIAQIKRAIGLVPVSISTTNQMAIAKRAMGILRQEVEIASKLLDQK